MADPKAYPRPWSPTTAPRGYGRQSGVETKIPGINTRSMQETAPLRTVATRTPADANRLTQPHATPQATPMRNSNPNKHRRRRASPHNGALGPRSARGPASTGPLRAAGTHRFDDTTGQEVQYPVDTTLDDSCNITTGVCTCTGRATRDDYHQRQSEGKQVWC